jgi:hypothetical protein
MQYSGRRMASVRCKRHIGSQDQSVNMDMLCCFGEDSVVDLGIGLISTSYFIKSFDACYFIEFSSLRKERYI